MEKKRVKSLVSEAIFDPSRHFIGSPAGGEKKELLMECSHLVDPVAVSGGRPETGRYMASLLL